MMKKTSAGFFFLGHLILFSSNFLSLISLVKFTDPMVNPAGYPGMHQIHEYNQILFNIIVYYLPFTLPPILVTLYLLPVARNIRLFPDKPLSEKNRTRIINMPITASFLAISGWGVGLIMLMAFRIFTYSWESILSFIGYTANVALFLLLAASLCFVVSYHLMQLTNIKLWIPRLLPDRNLSQIKGAITLPIIFKFYIFAYSVSIYPLIIVMTTLMKMQSGRLDRAFSSLLILVSLGFIFVGIFLTYLFSKNFQTPLIAVERAAKKIRYGHYDIDITVTSVDEVGTLGESVIEMARELKQQDFIKETFGKVVDPAVRDHLLEGHINLGGEERRAAILFSDIRSFTAISEKLSAAEIMNILNIYYQEMSTAISLQQGMVNKMMGDGILAVFGVPLAALEAGTSALRAAIGMENDLRQLNIRMAKEGFPRLSQGIGLHIGPVIAGNLGSTNRMEYTVIGDAVNLASRLENLTKFYGEGVLFTSDILEDLPDSSIFNYRIADRVKVKGKDIPVDIYQLLDSMEYETKQRRIETKKAFEQARQLYSNGDFKAAKLEFSAIKEQTPDDRLLGIYIRRCEQFKENPPRDWDGVIRMDKR